MIKNRKKFIVFVTIFLIACQPFEPFLSSPVSETNAAETQAAGVLVQPTLTPEPTEAVINPLTGLAVDDPALLERRPVMVKVSNYPQYGRPHAGLSFADIVFDYYIGYGTNRFLAVYYGQDSSQIGPVRSGRFVDAELVTMYGGILAYGSADEDTDAELNTKLGDFAISFLEAPYPAFVGLDTHSEVGVFANSAAISQFATSQGLDNGTPDLPGMVFSSEIPDHGKYADQVNILFNYYNRGEWHYDPSSGKYLRWIEYLEDEDDDTYEMIPLVDRVTGDQLAFSNIIIIFAEYTELAPSRHTIDIWGNDTGEKAYFFRDGQVFEGTWQVKNDSDPMQFFNDEGEPMALQPGNTWIVITGLNSTLAEIEPEVWQMVFMLP
jgi:hypothetical protein